MAIAEERVRPELLDASDETIEDAIGYADPMILRTLLFQLTGDERFAAMPAAKTGPHYKDMVAITNLADVAVLRAEAIEFLKAHRDAGAPELEVATERLLMSMSMATGLELDAAFRDLYVEELALDPFSRSLAWEQPPSAAQLTKFKVLVIGAGMAGLTAAVALKRAGISFTVLEKNSDVGGTWYENRYPGARVDTPSRAYTNTFGAHFGYPNQFCPWPETLRYFNWVADAFDVREDVILNTEVESLSWNQDLSAWEVTANGPEGETTFTANAVITAVGFLNRPLLPEIPGMDLFRGGSWHTARWPENFEVSGKTFAVIGTGCSGYQMIPELAQEAEHVTVFQRTPQWLMPNVGYLAAFPPQINWLDRNFPLYTNFMRFRLTMGSRAFLELAEIDPQFSEDPNACNPINKSLRDSCIGFLSSKIADPDLLAKMIPPHPVLSSRPVNCDPEYSVVDAIQRENVSLVSGGIRCITESGIEANDGTRYDVDVIVYATGFHATEYLFPMRVVGKGGLTLEQAWSEDGPRAYLGCMIPGFPNLWTTYGPNTNGGFQPSTFHELVTHFALRCMERLIVEVEDSVEVKPDACASYNELLDGRNARKVWSDPRARNYWWSAWGRSVTMNPLPGEELWPRLRNPEFENLEFH